MALTTLAVTLASKATPRNGFGGASTVWPALSSSRITPANPDALAKAPWTRTTVGPGMGFSSRLAEVTPMTLRHRTRASRLGVRRPARDRLFCALQPLCDHYLQAVSSRQGGRRRAFSLSTSSHGDRGSGA